MFTTRPDTVVVAGLHAPTRFGPVRVDGTADVLAKRAPQCRAAISQQAQMWTSVIIVNHELALQAAIEHQLRAGIVDLDIEVETLFDVRMRVEAACSAGAAVQLHCVR